MPVFHPQKRKKLSKAEHVTGFAKELIENEEWTSEKSAIDENLKKKLEKIVEGWISISYCMCRRAETNGTGKSLEG